jgi:hypothetical protein
LFFRGNLIDKLPSAFYSPPYRDIFASGFPEGIFMAAKKAGASAKARTKSETYQAVAAATGLSRKQVASVFDQLAQLVQADLGKKGPGVFTLPGLLKIKRVHKEATKTRTIPNPFKPGEMMTVKGKPARSVVKALALKNLKEMVK